MTDESWEIHTRTVLLLLPPLPWHGEKHLFTCMNAEHETRQRTDRWVAPLALEVIHHPPYPTCQICWTCRLLLPEPLRAEMKAFSFQETSRGSERRDKRFCFFIFMQMGVIFSTKSGDNNHRQCSASSPTVCTVQPDATTNHTKSIYIYSAGSERLQG